MCSSDLDKEQEGRESGRRLNIPMKNGKMDEEQFLPMLMTEAYQFFNRSGESKETCLVDFPEFKEGNQDPLEWLEAFERACRANRVPEERQIILVASYLKGTALTWYNRQTIRSWNNNMYPNTSFTHLFKTYFCNLFKLSQ